MTKRIHFACLVLVLLLFSVSCETQPSNTNSVVSNSPTPAVSASPTPVASEAVAVPVTLPVLDALFTSDSFNAELKSKLKLTDDQIASLRKAAADEIGILQEAGAEPEEGAAAEARDRAAVRSAYPA